MIILDFGSGNTCDWDDKATKDGFNGFLKVGQVIEV